MLAFEYYLSRLLPRNSVYSVEEIKAGTLQNQKGWISLWNTGNSPSPCLFPFRTKGLKLYAPRELTLKSHSSDCGCNMIQYPHLCPEFLCELPVLTFPVFCSSVTQLSRSFCLCTIICSYSVVKTLIYGHLMWTSLDLVTHFKRFRPLTCLLNSWFRWFLFTPWVHLSKPVKI